MRHKNKDLIEVKILNSIRKVYGYEGLQNYDHSPMLLIQNYLLCLDRIAQLMSSELTYFQKPSIP